MTPKAKTCIFCKQSFTKDTRGESMVRFAARDHCRSPQCSRDFRRMNQAKRSKRFRGDRDKTLSWPYKTHPVIDRFLRLPAAINP